MSTIVALLTAAKAGSGIPSNYRLAKVLDVTEHTVSNWQNGRAVPNEALTAKMAALAGLDPGVVLAEMAAERAKDDETKGMWLAVAERLKQAPLAAAAALAMALTFAGTPAPSQAGESAYGADSLCVMSTRRRRDKALRASLGKAIKKARAH